MRNTLMVSVAVAALLTATGFATAQGVNQSGAKASESAAAVSPKGEAAEPTKAPAARGAATATPGAPPAEGMPQHAQNKPDAKHTNDVKADGNSKPSEAMAPATTSREVKAPVA